MVHDLNVIHTFNAWWFQEEHKQLNAFLSLDPVLKRWREKNMQFQRMYLFFQGIVKAWRAGNVRTKSYTICFWSSLQEAFELFFLFSLPAVLRLTPLEWVMLEKMVIYNHCWPFDCCIQSGAVQIRVNNSLATNILCTGDQFPPGHLSAIPERVKSGAQWPSVWNVILFSVGFVSDCYFHWWKINYLGANKSYSST